MLMVGSSCEEESQEENMTDSFPGSVGRETEAAAVSTFVPGRCPALDTTRRVK